MVKKMKRFLCLLTCLLLVFTLTGCGSNEKENNNNKETEEKEKDEETKKENKKATVSCTGHIYWNESFDEIDDSSYNIFVEFDESGKMVKHHISLEVELPASYEQDIEIYRDSANELCTASQDDTFITCNTTVDGMKITTKAEYNLINEEKMHKLPTQQEFIEKQEEEFGMACTVEK